MARTCSPYRPRPASSPAYGSQSFRRHLSHAIGLGLPVRVLRDSRLTLDIDNPDDLSIRSSQRRCRHGCERTRPTTRRRFRLDQRTCRRRAVALAIGAHPDDVEFGAGGTLAKWAHRRLRRAPPRADRRFEGHVEPGCGHRRAPHHPTSRADRGSHPALRREPTPSSPARSRSSGQIDGEFESSLVLRGEVARCIRTVRPDVVLGHDPWKRYRLHPDHRHAGLLGV